MFIEANGTERESFRSLEGEEKKKLAEKIKGSLEPRNKYTEIAVSGMWVSPQKL